MVSQKFGKEEKLRNGARVSGIVHLMAASAMISATLQTRKRMKRMGWACRLLPHSHWHSPEEIAIIEAAGKIPRNRERERERRRADNARLPHCLAISIAPLPATAMPHISFRQERREGLGQ